MDTGRARLAGEMDARRLELGLRWSGVARQMRMSVQNLARIRNGEIAVTKDAAAAIERALRWTTGSVQRALDGGRPELAEHEETPATTRMAILTATSEQLVEMRQVVEDVLGAETANRWLTGALEMRAAQQSGSNRTRRPS